MLRYDPQTALVVVDVQNDFADPAGSLSVASGEAVVGHANSEIAMAQGAGALVVFTQDWHPESTPHFAKDGGIWPVHCVADTWGAALHPDLAVPDDALRVRKGVNGEDGYSGFAHRRDSGGLVTLGQRNEPRQRQGDLGSQTEPSGVEGRVLDAVVTRETGDDDAPHAGLRKQHAKGSIRPLT